MSYSFQTEKVPFPVSKIPLDIDIYQNVLSGILKGRLISNKRRYFDPDKYKGDDLIDILIRRNSNFLLGILSWDRQEILITHLFFQWKWEEALSLIQKRWVESISIDMLQDKVFPFLLKNFPDSKDIFQKLIKILSQHPDFFSYSYDSIFPLVRYLVFSFIDERDYKFSKEIIEWYFPEWEKEIALLVIEILEWKKEITKKEVLLFSHPHIQRISQSTMHLNPLTKYIKLIEFTWVDILVLRDIIETIELTWEKEEFGKVRDTYDINRKVRKTLYQQGDFKEVERFMKAVWDIQYYKGEILNAEFEYHFFQKDKEKLKKVMESIMKYYHCQDINIEHTIQEISEQKQWHERLSNYEIFGNALLSKIAFECLFWQEQIAKQYMDWLANMV